MSFFIIVGRNGGYPCIPELSEQYETGSSPPFCDMMMRVENGNYPTLKMLPDVAPELFSLPYPDGLLRCDERFNNGYPFNVNLSTAEKVTNSKGESTYEDKPITIKNYTWDNGMQRYKAVAKGDGFVVSFWGYDADDIMFRISAREYIL